MAKERNSGGAEGKSDTQAQYLIPEAISKQPHSRGAAHPFSSPGQGPARPAARVRAPFSEPLPGAWVLLSRLESPSLRMTAVNPGWILLSPAGLADTCSRCIIRRSQESKLIWFPSSSAPYTSLYEQIMICFYSVKPG